MNKPLRRRTENRQMMMIMVIKGKDADMSDVNIDRRLIHRRSHEETSGTRPATAIHAQLLTAWVVVSRLDRQLSLPQDYPNTLMNAACYHFLAIET